MGSLLNTLWKTVILDDAAYQEWRERPNVFLRGITMMFMAAPPGLGLSMLAMDQFMFHICSKPCAKPGS